MTTFIKNTIKIHLILLTIFINTNSLAEAKKMTQSNYIHGAYQDEEQKRLELQASLIKPFIWQDLKEVLKNLTLAQKYPFLEIGCGVAAQTIDLLEALPDKSYVIGIDIDSTQISMAKEKMGPYTKYKDLVSFRVMDATVLDFPDNALSGAYISWVLEHMPKHNALKLLKNLKAAVKNDGVIIINETHMDPEESLKIGTKGNRDSYPPHTKKFIQAMIKAQAELEGNANFGDETNMRAFFAKASLSDVNFKKKIVHFESNNPAFKIFAHHAVKLFKGVLPVLIKNGTFTDEDFQYVEEEIMNADFIHWEFGQAVIRVKK